MQTKTRQIGGIYNTAFLLFTIGVAALLVLTLAPIYMDEAKAAKIVSQTASSPQYYNQSILQIRKTLSKRWDIDAVKNLDVKDVKLKKDKNGKALAYSYEVRASLFANIELVVVFDKQFQMARGGG